MPTLNLSLSNAWTQVAADSHAGFVAQSSAVGHLEWATTATAAAPDAGLSGLLLPAQSLVGRGVLGPGFVWARALPPLAAATLSVTR